MRKFVSWRRVSTQGQAKTGLGLSAQKNIIEYFVNSEKGELIADFEEAYTGKDLNGCKELQKAIEFCKEHDATLIIAKTDRFRNTIEALQIYDEMEGNIFFCDLPHTDKFTLTLFFALAEREALLVKLRTTAALNEIQEKLSRGEEHVSKRGNVVTSLGRPKGCTASQNAIEASITASKNKAKANAHNIAFRREMNLWEKRNGTLKSNADIQAFADELNSHEFKTATGMDFDLNRCRAMIVKVRKLYIA